MSLRRATECLIAFAAVLVLLCAASRGIGVVWDEGIYFLFSDTLVHWFVVGCPFDQPSLEHHWSYDPYQNPHPPFMKILSAISSRLLGDTLGFPLDHRFAHHLFAAGCLALSYGLLRPVYSAAAASTAILFGVLQPRVFGELLLATTDGPIAVAWLVLPILLWRIVATDDARSRALLRVVFFLILGMAAATKFTGLLVAAPLFAYLLYRRRLEEIGYLIGASVYALAFTILMSPDKWRHPIDGVIGYLSYPLQRHSILISSMYFGEVYGFSLPWHYFIVMSLVTVPLAIWLLVPGLIWQRLRTDSLLVCIFFPAAFWIVLALLPATPKHDATRQFISFYPLLGIVAEAGFRGLRDWLARMTRVAGATSIRVALRTAVIAVLAMSLWASHPHELSYYNPVIGGIRGAEKRGMEMSYFFDSVDPDFVRTMNATFRQGTKLQMFPYCLQVLFVYEIHGSLRTDIRILREDAVEEPDFLVVLRRRAYVEDEWYESLTPVYETKYDGVSLAKLVKISR